MIIFVAGASGVVGQRLLPLLRQDGHRIVASTRSPAKADALRALGAEPVIVDVFDKAALAQAVQAARTRQQEWRLITLRHRTHVALRLSS